MCVCVCVCIGVPFKDNDYAGVSSLSIKGLLGEKGAMGVRGAQGKTGIKVMAVTLVLKCVSYASVFAVG